MRSTVVLLSEIVAAGTMSPSDFLGDGTRSCALCGLTPASVVKARRPDPVSALLEPFEIDESDPQRRSRYRCRSREGCASRQAIAERAVPDA